MTERFTNEATTTLAAGINASVTSLVVSSSAGFPAANFRVRIDNEILLVTAVAGTTWTVTRGVESTTAASHAVLATVAHVLTAGGLQQAILDAVTLPWVELSDSSNQACANTTVTDITWATEVSDAQGFHAAGSANLIVPTGYGGVYFAIVQAAWDAGGTGTRQLQIWMNGAAVSANAVPPMAALAYVVCAALFKAADGATIKAIGYQDSGGSLNLNGAAGMKLKLARIGS